MKNESEFINKVLNETKKLLINILILMILIKLSLYAENGILVTLLIIRVVIVFNIMYIILKLLICLFKMLKHPKLTIKEINKCTTESEEI